MPQKPIEMKNIFTLNGKLFPFGYGICKLHAADRREDPGAGSAISPTGHPEDSASREGAKNLPQILRREAGRGQQQ
jgi:hypothetical protein